MTLNFRSVGILICTLLGMTFVNVTHAGGFLTLARAHGLPEAQETTLCHVIVQTPIYSKDSLSQLIPSISTFDVVTGAGENGGIAQEIQSKVSQINQQLKQAYSQSSVTVIDSNYATYCNNVKLYGVDTLSKL